MGCALDCAAVDKVLRSSISEQVGLWGCDRFAGLLSWL